eukprot:165133-Pyramimonas_sp.AAC.1
MGSLVTLRGGAAALFRPVPLAALRRVVCCGASGAGVPLAVAAVCLVVCRVRAPPGPAARRVVS